MGTNHKKRILLLVIIAHFLEIVQCYEEEDFP